MTHDFFQPQPVKDASVFLMRFIIHDWPDDKAMVILSHLREAAAPHTKLVLAEQLIQPLCPADQIKEIGVPGASVSETAGLPAPLVASGTMAMSYFLDLVSLSDSSRPRWTVR